MREWQCGRFSLPLGKKTYVMAILNLTPDSFSGDGRLGSAALDRARRLIDEGADILDVGGESTRPGAEGVDADEELRRVIPLIAAMATEISIPISIDTTKARVAREAVAAGAAIVNDISAATFDADMLETVAATDAGLVLMHLRGAPGEMVASEKQGAGAGHADIIAEVLDFWRWRIAAAQAAGIAGERIALDAGFGFGKSVAENMDLLRRGRELAALGYPTLSGTSRKSTIGKLLRGPHGDLPVEERLLGSAAAATLAIVGGADIVRVHDVKEMVQVARIADAAR